MANYIIHIGDGKCGSSSIQESLHAEREKLMKAGILYEPITSKSAHFAFVTLIGHKTRGNDDNLKKLATDAVRRIRKKWNGKDRILLSAESFLPLSPQEMRSILEQIDPLVGDVDLIAYVREPVSMYLSLVQQRLKGDSRFTRPDHFRRPIDTFLEAWKSDPLTSSLTVRLFDRSVLLGGDVVQDFSQILSNLSSHSVNLASFQVNSTLYAEQMMVLQRFRRTHQKDKDGKQTPESMQLVKFFSEMNAAGLVGTKPALNARARFDVFRGNTDLVRKLNELFPSLNIAMPEVAPPKNALEPQYHGLIGDILESSDRNIERSLISLIPFLTPSIFEVFGPDTEKALVEVGAFRSPSIHNTVKRYWRQTNCISSVSKLNKQKLFHE